MQNKSASSSQISKGRSFKENLSALVILILVTASLGLAIVDEEYRSNFADLAKIVVGGWFYRQDSQR